MPVKKSWKFNTPLLRRLLLASLALHIATVVFFVYKRLYYTGALPVNSSYDAGLKFQMADRAKLYRLLPKDENEILFVGNSITLFFPVSEFLKDPLIKNRGIGYNRTIELLERIDDLVASKPRKIFLMIGINDLNSGLTGEPVFINFKKIITAIQVKSPGTIVYVQSILPTAEPGRTDFIKDLNQMYESYCKANQIRFINLYPHFVKNGVLNPEYSFDGLHINTDGYLVWKNQIEQFVLE